MVHLAEAIASVQAQIYSNWQLCIADDASTDARVRPLLEKIATSDSRIVLTFREKNGHIAAASKSALTLASGDWCALLDQDDLLPPTALAFVVCEIKNYPEARLIYSDEDKINEEGLRSDPYFKPDWNPELFLGQNYINHLGVYHAGILRDLGGFREGFAGSQDYDLALRLIEKLRPEQVRHIPRILYHWRAIRGSLANAIDAKPDATNGARRALTEHLQRSGIKGQVAACRENPARHRVTYELPESPPLVSIIIPTRDRVNLLRRCVEGIREQTEYDRIELVVVDNDSTIGSTRDYLAELSREKDTQVLHESGAFNYSRLNNLGAQAARGDVLAFLNNDIEVDEPGWLREMVSPVLQPRVGAVGARLWYPNQTLQHGGVVLGLGGMAAHAFGAVPRGSRGYFDRLSLQQDCSAVTGACMIVRKDVFQETGGFDEEHFAVSYNDIDFCLRLRERGLRVILTPYANLIHHESVSRGRVRTPEADEQFFREAAAFRKKWGAQLLSDPFYNPNLSLKAPGFALAFPPRIAPMILPFASDVRLRSAELAPA
ncbi:MAG: glycosyltransferase family 2 protein [Chthoniobacterales bacterium]|nr:glycosyltransferase family 2 protein [Chthoniobacterales bacterium]